MSASEFTYSTSRSPAIVTAFIAILAVEMIVVHILLFHWMPVVAWVVLVTSLLAIVWLVADYRARGDRAVRVDAAEVVFPMGLSRPFLIARPSVRRVIRPSWRDIPSEFDAPYVNLTAPAQPNVLLVLAAREPIPMGLGIRKKAHLVGLHLDEPDRFVSLFAPGGDSRETTGEMAGESIASVDARPPAASGAH
jgi:hypothetical protein